MELVRVAYFGGFGLAGAVCFVSLRRVSRVADPDTQRGLGALLVLSGVWAVTHVGRLLPLSPPMQIGFYLVGLIVGLATVGAWLYFCSAYTGHDYHRRPWIRRTALGLYLGIVLIKITNPLHGLYFDTVRTTQPFAHTVVQLGTIHWVVTGLSYTLSAIGFYLLYETLSESNTDVRVLGALVATTALPLGFYLASLVDVSGLITLHYEPLGVAVFAVGVLYAVNDQFVAVPRFWRTQIIDDLNEAVVVVDDFGRVREYNRRAVETFPALRECEGTPLADASPELERIAGRTPGILTVGQHDTDAVRYFHVTSTPLTRVDVEVGRAVVCTDVTSVETQRRQLKHQNEQLERQNEQLDDFADAITHELRNTLAIAEGYFDMVVADQSGDDDGVSDDAVTAVGEAHDRMAHIVTDLARLAQSAQTIDDIEDCSLSAVADSAFDDLELDGLSVRVAEDATVRADRSSLTELLSTAGRFADLHGATVLTVAVDTHGLTITTDGDPLPAAAIEDVFSYGEAVPSAETGMLFPTMRVIASSHGWSVEVDPTYRDGVRIEIADVETRSVAE